jgi:transcriptional regulator with XRE-family HTH domain
METELEKTLRRAIKESGLSYYRLAIDCDISAGSISRFMADTNSLRLDIAGRLCERLGLELKPKQKGA